MKPLWRRKLRRTTLISVGLSASLLGLFLARFGTSFSQLNLLVLPILGIIAYKRSLSALGAVILVGMFIGLWRGDIMYRQVAGYTNLFNQTVSLRGKIADDSGYDEARNQTIFNLQNVRHIQKSLPGRVQVKVLGKKTVTRGDEIIVSGKLRPSIGTSRQGSISAAKIVILRHNTNLFEKIRARFFASIHNSLPEPQASIGLGYLVGLRVSIPKNISDQLALVGLTHIVAVSGYNLTIIVQAVRRLLGKKSAYQSLVFSLLLIAGFVAVAGGSAPINRAVVVSVFSLLAWYFGREFKPVLLLLLSGVVTAFASPLYVWGDPGWYLSFLAFAGILVLGPLAAKAIFKQRRPGIVSGILVETMAAQICTIPYTLYLFGGVSVIAPIANVLILPFIPFIMLMIFVIGIVGMVLPGISSVLAIIPASLLTLQLWIIERLSKLPWAHLDMQITAGIMIAMFVGIIILILYLKRTNQGEPATQWQSDLI